MNRHIKGTCKEVMKQIKKQWTAFTEDDIEEIRYFHEERERKWLQIPFNHKQYKRCLDN